MTREQDIDLIRSRYEALLRFERWQDTYGALSLRGPGDAQRLVVSDPALVESAVALPRRMRAGLHHVFALPGETDTRPVALLVLGSRKHPVEQVVHAADIAVDTAGLMIVSAAGLTRALASPTCRAGLRALAEAPIGRFDLEPEDGPWVSGYATSLRGDGRVRAYWLLGARSYPVALYIDTEL